MRYKTAALASCLLAPTLTAAHAVEPVADQSFRCVAPMEIASLVFEDDSMRVSNFAFRSGSVELTGAPMLVLEASGMNKTGADLVVSVEAIGMREGAAFFAVSATPAAYAWRIAPRESEVLAGSVVTDLNDAAHADTACIRVRRWQSIE